MMKILSTRASHLKRPRRPLRHASACHLPRCGRGGFWFTVCSFPRPRRGRCRATRGDRGARCSYAFLTTEHRCRPRRPLRHAARATSPAAAGEAFGLRHAASPRPRRGKCRATRGDRGARCSYAFLTIEHRYRPRRPLRHAARATSPAAAGEAFGLRHAAFPVRDGGGAEQREAIGALVAHTHFSR